MNANSRKFKESPLWQGEDESIAYDIDVSPWGSSPASPVVTVKDSAGADVTEDVCSGSATANSNTITTPVISGLTAGTTYRLEIQFTIDGNTLEVFGDLIGQE